MSGLIFLAILFYAISYIAKEGKAKRKPGGAARPQRNEAASAQLSGPFAGTPYAPRSGAYRPAAAPRPEPDVELCTHDPARGLPAGGAFKEASSGSMNYVSTEGEGTESVECSLTSHTHPGVHSGARCRRSSSPLTGRARLSPLPLRRRPGRLQAGSNIRGDSGQAQGDAPVNNTHNKRNGQNRSSE